MCLTVSTYGTRDLKDYFKKNQFFEGWKIFLIVGNKTPLQLQSRYMDNTIILGENNYYISNRILPAWIMRPFAQHFCGKVHKGIHIFLYRDCLSPKLERYVFAKVRGYKKDFIAAGRNMYRDSAVFTKVQIVELYAQEEYRHLLPQSVPCYRSSPDEPDREPSKD